MEDEQRDLITVEDEAGNELKLEIVDYFFFEGKRYAVLVDSDADPEDEDLGAYLMGIEEDGEDEVFYPLDEDEFDRVSEAWYEEEPDEQDDDGEDL